MIEKNEFIADFQVSLLNPLLPLMTEIIQWSFHHHRDHRDDTDQVPEKLKEVWSDLINRLDFNEELGKDVHNEVKKMFGGFLDSVVSKSPVGMDFVQPLVNKLVQVTKQYLIEVKEVEF